MKKGRKRQIIDGLGPTEKRYLSSAIRQIWYYSRSRTLAIRRHTDADGNIHCAKCDDVLLRPQVDHIEACGPVESDGYIRRTFCPSVGLRVLCFDCHQIVTQIQRETGVWRKHKK